MDPKPEVGYKMFKSLEISQEWAKEMQSNWNGTCAILGYATQEEIFDFIRKNSVSVDDKTLADIINPYNYYGERSQAEILATLILGGYDIQASDFARQMVTSVDVFLEVRNLIEQRANIDSLDRLLALSCVQYNWSTI